jgi:hypothetical protein
MVISSKIGELSGIISPKWGTFYPNSIFLKS